MKIGVIFDTFEKGGGGYFQSICTAKLIDQILEHHGGKAGISQRNLDGKFADAKRNLKGS